VILSRPGHSGRDEPGFKKQRSETIHGALVSPGSLLALVQELSHVPRGLPEIAEAW